MISTTRIWVQLHTNENIIRHIQKTKQVIQTPQERKFICYSNYTITQWAVCVIHAGRERLCYTIVIRRWIQTLRNNTFSTCERDLTKQYTKYRRQLRTIPIVMGAATALSALCIFSKSEKFTYFLRNRCGAKMCKYFEYYQCEQS